MNLVNTLGYTFLSFYLIIVGFSAVSPDLVSCISYTLQGMIALVSGVLILVGRCL